MVNGTLWGKYLLLNKHLPFNCSNPDNLTEATTLATTLASDLLNMATPHP